MASRFKGEHESRRYFTSFRIIFAFCMQALTFLGPGPSEKSACKPTGPLKRGTPMMPGIKKLDQRKGRQINQNRPLSPPIFEKLVMATDNHISAEMASLTSCLYLKQA